MKTEEKSAAFQLIRAAATDLGIDPIARESQAQLVGYLAGTLVKLSEDKGRLDWLKAEPYERLQKVREWLPISYIPPAPDNLRAAIDNAMKHDPNFRP